MSGQASFGLEQVDFSYTPQGVEHTISDASAAGGNALAMDLDALKSRIKDRFQELNDNYRLLEDGAGRRVETTAVNTDKKDIARIHKEATPFSGVIVNPGNMFELALQAALDTEAQISYSGSQLAPPSDPMPPRDRKIQLETGRVTTGSGASEDPYEPLPSIRDRAALIFDTFHPNYITGDVQAVRSATGLAAALPPDVLKGFYGNNPSGVASDAESLTAQLAEDVQSRRDRWDKEMDQLYSVTPRNITLTKEGMHDVYAGFYQHEHKIAAVVHPISAIRAARAVSAFGKYSDLEDLTQHAFFNDLRAVMLQQNAPFTLQFNQKEAMDDMLPFIRFGELVMAGIPEEYRTPERQLRLLIGRGGRDAHTDRPQDRTRAERVAFPDIPYSVIRAATHKPRFARIFALPDVGVA